MELLHTPLFGLLLTLSCYRLSVLLYQKSGSSLIFHPFMVSMVSVSIVLKIIGINFDEYLQQTSIIQFLLGPATVALAWPMYRQLHVIGKIWQRLVVATLIGGFLAAIICVGIAWVMGAPTDVLASLVPKSITTPIAIEVVKVTGGSASLAAGVIAVTGIIGAFCAPPLLRWMKITDERVIGFTIGLTAHAIGTARAFELGNKAGAFSSLALSLNGAITALVVPVLWILLENF